MIRIVSFWTNLRSSLWFVPGVMLIASFLLALGLIELDSAVDGEWQRAFPRIFGLGADGSRGMLTAIASSMLTVAALTFALTLNAMTQASGQFSPRIFRNFLRDRANQFVLGYFVSVFAYCLLVLRTIRGGDEIKFVPSIAVIVGLLLAVGGIIVLIFFIHHIASSLQITTIIDHIVKETAASIEKMFPEKMGEATEPEQGVEIWQPNETQTWSGVPALSAGYVQSVDTDGLLEYAEKHKAVLKMERGIGQFVGRGAALVSLTSDSDTLDRDLAVDDDATGDLNALFSIESHRTIEQDAGFGIRQIVDIALKALSPGVNDTTTAITCIDFLSEIVGEVARRRFPSKIRSKAGVPRVIVLAPGFQDYVEMAFDQIRISGKANLAVFERLAEAVVFVAQCTTDESRRKSLKDQIELIADFAEKTLETDYEREKFRRNALKNLGWSRDPSR